MDYSILINWTRRFASLRVSGVRVHFLYLIETPVCKQCRYLSAASDLGLHRLPRSQLRDATRRIWVNQKRLVKK